MFLPSFKRARNESGTPFRPLFFFRNGKAFVRVSFWRGNHRGSTKKDLSVCVRGRGFDGQAWHELQGALLSSQSTLLEHLSRAAQSIFRSTLDEYWKKLASVRVKLIWVGSAHELVAVSSTNVGSVFDKCRPSWNFVKEWRGVQGGVVYRQLAIHNTPLVYSRSSELLTCIAQDSSTWCVHVCNKRVFNVPVTRTTLHELVGHAPTSAAC